MKLILKRFSMAAIGCALAMTGAHAALGGTNSSGGGNELVAQFVSLATLVLNNSTFMSSPDRDRLQATLNTVKIVSAPVLVDPVSQQPIPNQRQLLAWGSPGLIQLKESTNQQGDASWEDKVKAGRSMAHLVIHELYRASGLVGADGRSVDDNFEITIAQYHLDKFDPGPDSTCFVSRVRAALPDGSTVLIEDTPVGFSMGDASTLGLQQCEEEYPDAQCVVAGHAIVDCPR